MDNVMCSEYIVVAFPSVNIHHRCERSQTAFEIWQIVPLGEITPGVSSLLGPLTNCKPAAVTVD